MVKESANRLNHKTMRSQTVIDRTVNSLNRKATIVFTSLVLIGTIFTIFSVSSIKFDDEFYNEDKGTAEPDKKSDSKPGLKTQEEVHSVERSPVISKEEVSSWSRTQIFDHLYKKGLSPSFRLTREELEGLVTHTV